MEEVIQADLLIEVVDSTYEDHDFHITVTNNVLEEIGAGNKEKIIAYNKIDAFKGEIIPTTTDEVLKISAKTGEGLDALLKRIEEIIFAGNIEAKFLIPYDRGDVFSYICKNGISKKIEHKENGIEVTVELRDEDYNRVKKYDTL